MLPNIRRIEITRHPPSWRNELEKGNGNRGRSETASAADAGWDRTADHNEEGWPVFEVWKKYEEITMHFNDLLMRLRTQALAAVAALATIVGIFSKAGADALTCNRIFSAFRRVEFCDIHVPYHFIALSLFVLLRTNSQVKPLQRPPWGKPFNA
jgi:hypothetical protein